MFFVFNKQKIITYAVSIVTVILLFCLASGIQQEEQESIQTSTNTSKLLPVYQVKTEEKKVALTMNCAW